MLRLTVVSARINLTKNKKADCMVVASFRGIEKVTSIVTKKHTPVWNETVEWPLDGIPLDSHSSLHIKVKGHKDSHKKREFGCNIILLDELLREQDHPQAHNEIPLLDSKKQPTGNTITFQLMCTPKEVKTKEVPHEGVSQGQKIPQGRRDLQDKVQDFQVWVRIISGRQLHGNNIRPVVKVRIGNKVHLTRVRQGNDPHFNEIFFQDFHQKPSQVFEELICIKVLNSHLARKDSVIGIFKMDIGSVYNAPGHAIMKKWLSLYDPDNVSAGVRGYLKVSLYVVVAGASAPVEEENTPDDDDDVESNLLTYSSVHSHIATIFVKILRGEDIPPVSHSLLKHFHFHSPKKITVNPFVKVTFAGKTLKTKVVHKNSNPVWEQMLVFPVQLPTMCEQIVLTVYDWDSVGQAKALGSASLKISQVSSTGHEVETGDNRGFPPTFGPSFLTLYGSPHEFLDVHIDHQSLNQGKGEGVAYCGRLLLQVQTGVEDKPMMKVEPIPQSDICKEEWSMLRKKFALAAIFYSATMLPEAKDPIQFEISMGNYGNKFDMTCKPFSSTTQYSYAVFDGNYYYFLPWYDTKPVLVVTSEWEDVTHRMNAFNALQAVCHNLEKHLQFLQRESYPGNLDRSWRRRLQEMMALCGQIFSALERSNSSTSLDQELKSVRQFFLQDMMHSIKSFLEKTSPGLELLTQLEDWLQTLTEITHEPQISLPDVIIWMLFQDRRVAYARVCPADILYGESGMGIHCGKLQTIFLKHFPVQKKGFTSPVQLRLRLWLSLMSDASELKKYFPGRLCVCAETYENQAKWLGRWSTKTLGSHPPYSDITGKLIVPREGFQPPKGWCWDGGWHVEPQRRGLLDRDINHWEVVEEVFENETRSPGGSWIPALIPNTTVSGAKQPSMDKIVCPEGWHFVEEWKLEHDGPVDFMGWEYGFGTHTSGLIKSWTAAEKTYHTHRRRHWQRKRQRNVRPQISDLEVTSFLKLHSEETEPACWEYAAAPDRRFHLKQKHTAMFRRRCWRRTMVPSDHSMSSAIFLLEGTSELYLDKLEHSKETKHAPKRILKYNTPLINCVCPGPTYYQLRCYLFQARGVLSTDMYAQVCFLHVSQHTEIYCNSHLWDQTLLFSDIIIYGDTQSVLKEPPFITMELFKKTYRGKDEFLGRSLCQPIVHVNVDTRMPPRLKWYPVKKGKRSFVEVLAAFELLLDEKNGNLGSVPPLPQNEKGNFIVPKEIRPTLLPMKLEIFALGIREMKTFQLLSVQSPSLLVECGGKCIQTCHIRDVKKNPNFPTQMLNMPVDLPEEKYYLPPIVLKVLDNRPFGYKPLVGQCTVRDLKPYFINPGELHSAPPTQDLPASLNPSPVKICSNTKYLQGEGEFSWWRKIFALTCDSCTGDDFAKCHDTLTEEGEFDWWSKFFASIGDIGHTGEYLDKGHDTLMVYNTELESIPSFHGLQDFCQTFKLQRPKSHDDEEEDDEDLPLVGEVKASFRIYSTSEHFQILPPQLHDILASGPQECLLRIYIVRGLNLPPRDKTGLCDPYIKISFGKKKMDDRQNYIVGTLNPVFGKLFELSCVIPLQKDLKVSVFDYDLLSSDDKIGETVIDLENRLLSLFGANCGLPQSYRVCGPNTWRDQLLPSQLLYNTCSNKGWSPPTYTQDGQEVSVNNKKFCLSTFESRSCTHPQFGPPKERLSLHVLRTLGLVPEHVETRSLYNAERPTMEQGKLQMWVDIFPVSLGVPGPPFNISPRIPKKYVLRCIVWQTQDVDLQETNIFGEMMTDIYVKGWMDGMESDKQRTDIHYRSLDGSAVFNWRFIFNFEYLNAEQMCVIRKRDHLWSLDKNALHLLPKLIIQVWDNDRLSSDDFLGVLELNLAHLPRAVRHPEHCSLKILQGSDTRCGFLQYLYPISSRPRFLSLFRQKSIRGWWPCAIQSNRKPRLSGKVELSLELLTEKEAEERPAGKGQEDPNINPKLDPPVRHDSSFLWFTSPFKSLRYILWRRYRWRLLCTLFFILVLLLIAVFIYSASGYLSMKMIKPLSSEFSWPWSSLDSSRSNNSSSHTDSNVLEFLDQKQL